MIDKAKQIDVSGVEWGEYLNYVTICIYQFPLNQMFSILLTFIVHNVRNRVPTLFSLCLAGFLQDIFFFLGGGGKIFLQAYHLLISLMLMIDLLHKVSFSTGLYIFYFRLPSL